MNSVKIQQLLKADPIRPPARKRSPSPNAQISPIQTPSQKGTPLPASTHASFFTIKSNSGEPKDDYDPGEDEKISVSLPYTNFNGSEKESPNFRYREFVTNNKNSISRYSRNENHSPELVEKDLTNLPRKHEKRISFGAKKSGELGNVRNNNLGKENNGRQLNYNDDSYSSSSHPKNLQTMSKKADAAFTFESEEVKHSKSSHDINPNHTSREELQQTMTEKFTPKGLDRSVFEQQTIRTRRKSQNMQGDTYYMPTQPMHRKVLSEKSFEKFFGRKASDPLGHLSHLMIPEKSAISERYCQSTNRNFYSETLRELENVFKDQEDDFQVASDINKADKKDQIAFNILKSRCGQNYAEGLYYIYARYSKDNDMGKTKMTYQKFISFMKNFNLFSNTITKEFLGIAYAKRCPNKMIDFAAFIDILFKISKRQISSNESQSNSIIGFKIYLDRYILNNYLHLLEQQPQTKTPRLSVFSNTDDSEQLALDVLLENESLLNHIFTLYETFDIQYHNKSVLLFKDFKKFCYDYTLVPVICTLGEAIEVFRKFQVGSKQVIDYKGFIMVLVSFATIGFGDKKTHNKYDNLAKQVSKFFDVLAQINSRVCDQLVSKHIAMKKK